MTANFRNIALVRRLVYSIGIYLIKNLVYTVQFGNIKIKHKGGIGSLKLRQNSKEEQFLASLDLNGKTIYDIGAYKGILTALFSKSVGNSGTVMSFEPSFGKSLLRLRTTLIQCPTQ